MSFFPNLFARSSRAISLSSGPLAYVGRTVSKFDSVCFACGKKPYGFAIYKQGLRQIDSDSGLLLCDQFPKRVHMLSIDSPADAQHHQGPRANDSFDFAAHRTDGSKTKAIL
jgi:hypothetical protein